MSSGIPYVPLDCQLDEKFDYIEAEFGLIGFAIVVKLFQRIYGGHGYYCEWNDRVALLFAHKIGVGGDVVREVVSAAIRECIFDKGMYEKYGVLTSRGIQKRFSAVAKRRKQIFDKPEYALPCCDLISGGVDNSGENVCNSGENVCNSTISKVKGSKVNESNGSETAERSTRSDLPASQTDLKKLLTEKYGAENVAEYEQRYKNWQSRNGKSGGDMYSVIARWMKQDGVKLPDNHVGSFDMDEVMQSVKRRYKEAH